VILVIRALLIRAAAVGMLLWVAAFNGYPIVFSDTGSYIVPGRWPYRAPGYSVFTRLTSMGISGWFIVVAQAIIVVYVLDETCEYLIGSKQRYRELSLPATVSLLAAYTSLPWLVSLLMPDVFAGIVFLCSFLLIFNDQLRLKNRMAVIAILMIATGSHSSLLPIAAAFVTVLILVRFISGQLGTAALRKVVLVSIVAPLVAVGLGTATLNYGLGQGFKYSPSGRLFLLSRLFADGLASDYLHDNCPEQPLIACRYLSSLPLTQTEFLFRNHPLLNALEGHEDEIDAIVHGTLFGYKRRFITSSIKATFVQLAALRTGDEVRSYAARTWNSAVIEHVFHRDFPAFQQSRESRNHLLPLADAGASIDTVAFWLSVIVCVVFAWTNRRGRRNDFFYSALLFLLINAAVCATFSGVYDRYQSRVAWLGPLCLAMYVCSLMCSSSEACETSLAPGPTCFPS